MLHELRGLHVRSWHTAATLADMEASVKSTIRDVITTTLCRVAKPALVTSKASVWVVLTFHRVLPEHRRQDYPYPHLAVTPDELEWILSVLKSHFQLATVSEAAARFAGDDRQRLLSVTFDDGQLDNLQHAAPVLQRHDVPATFYVPTDFIGSNHFIWHDRIGFAWQQLRLAGELDRAQDLIRQQGSQAVVRTFPDFVKALKALAPEQRKIIVDTLSETQVPEHLQWARVMTWEEVSQLSSAGHEIGSHSVSHNLLDQLSQAEQKAEMYTSYEMINSKLGCAPESFCFPNGNYDETTLGLLRNSPYTNAVTTRWGTNASDADLMCLQRCDMDPFTLTDRHGKLSESRLLTRLSGLMMRG